MFKDGQPFPETLFIYGQPAVGKTSIVSDFLNAIDVSYAFINCVECYSHKLLYENIASQVFYGVPIKCDNLMDLIHYLKLAPSLRGNSKRFIVVSIISKAPELELILNNYKWEYYRPQI